ncbi:MAG: phenylacetate--CoA ligase family protein [Winogradskyella sp.]|nr:phenylacetate--CoA ligase family protein [Winogradskyella sp.]
MMLNKLRNTSYWLLDSLRGAKVKNQLKEIERCINITNSPEVNKIRNNHLNRLLSHAIKTTPFYSDINEYNSLQNFPVISKVIIQENFELFRSSKYLSKEHFKVSTSGSTGVPFFLYQNKGKRIRNQADVIFFFKESGYNVGNRLYELEVWRDHNKKGKIKAWLQNALQFDISRLTDDRISSLIQILKNDHQSKKTMLGFASSYEMIAQYLERNQLFLKNLGITAAIANAEYLNSYTKKCLGKHLNTQVLSRYSSEELGIIAQQTLKSPNNFVINHASYYVEILDFKSENPVKIGEYGRIVVTDLFNYAMPIIRYDTGDIAKLGLSDDGSIQLDEIEGRKMDVIYDTTGNLISSFIVYTKFYKYYHLLKQYQFIQQHKKVYEIKLNLKEEKFDLEDELIASIKTDLGEDSQIIITYVNEIPPLSSGKRRKVINNYN